MKYIHLKSNELANGSPKLPPVSGMQVGEIAINYKDGYETLFIKNDNNEIVSFSSDDIIMAHAGGGGAAIDGLFSSVTYNSSAKKIYFYDKNNTKCGEVDTTDFIKDGMISSVTVSNGNLVMSFNTDAGKQDITLALTQIFNPSNYYTKTDIDGKGYLTGYTETDPTVPNWAKASTKPSYTLDEVTDGSTRKLSNYALSADVHTTISAVSYDARYSYKTGADDTAGEWTVEIPGITELYDGLTIKIRLEKSYNPTRNYLNVNNLGYKIVCVRRGSSLTSHYSQYSELKLTYRTDGCGEGLTSTKNLEGLVSGISYTDGWVVENYYDSTNVDALRNTYSSNYCLNRVTRYQILGYTADNFLAPLTLVDSGSYNKGATKPVNTVGFRPDKFLFYASTTIIQAGSAFTSHHSYLYEVYPTTSANYTFNSTLTPWKHIYLCGTYNSTEDLFYLETGLTEFYVQVPTNQSNLQLSSYFTEGKDYIFLGETYTENNYFSLHADHPLYHFDGTNLVKYEDYLVNSTNNSIAAHTANSTIHVTAAEKSTWNGKQNAISDLADIKNNASSGAAAYTAITAHTGNSSIHLTTGNVKTQIESYGYTTNTGTITGINMNGASKGSSGVVDLGTVITGETQLSTGTTGTQTGNALTAIAVDGHQIKITKATTFALSANTHSTITGMNSTLTAHTANSTIHVTAAEKSTWNGKQDALSNANVLNGITSTKVSNWDAAATNSHTHSNKTVLDGITTAKTASWDSVTAKTNNTDFTAHTSDTTIHFTTGDVKTQIESYGYTTNVGTVTGVSINGSTKSPSNGLVTLGTVITAETQLTTASTGTGNVITDITVSNHKITKTKGVTIPNWATATTKPAYTASEVGALPAGTTLDNVPDGSTRKLSNYALQSDFASHTGDSAIHVTATEKSTWNGKQDAISDLNTIKNNASSGATAYNNMVTGVTINGTAATKTNKVVAIPSASSSTFGVVKTGSFLTNSNGSISVSTGTSNSTVARGDHTHNAYATTGNLSTLSSQTVSHITASTLHMPAVTSSDNGKILQVVNGAWALVTPVSIYYGSTAPDNSKGNDGDIYIQQ